MRMTMERAVVRVGVAVKRLDAAVLVFGAVLREEMPRRRAAESMHRIAQA